MDDRNIREVTASDFYEGMADFKGVIATRSSGTFTALNTRGFNANYRITNNNKINVSSLNAGTYILKIKKEKSKNFVPYKFIKI